jgi:DNA-binding MarR family transcriptional regulator
MATDVTHPALGPSLGLRSLERIVVGSVGVTARAVATEAPDLTLLQWRVIVVLAGAPDGMAVSELAAHLASRLPAMSRLLGRLRDRRLIDTRKDAADGRVSIARLAPDGLHLWDRVSGRRREDLQGVLDEAGLDAAEASVLERVADRLMALA